MLQQRKRELLPIAYFHLVFTIPPAIAEITLQNKRAVFQILFRTSAETLLTIAADPKHLGAAVGFFSILHTWGQNVLFHPHLHCVVTGGGLSPDNQWIASRPDFFLSVGVLSRLFRRLFLEALESAYAKGELEFHGQLQLLGDPPSVPTSTWLQYVKPNGSFMPNHPLAAPNRSSNTSDATRTASPSAISACWLSKISR